jgi:hypothetical protein
MRVESRIFIWVAVFLLGMAAVYGWWSSVADGRVEVIGTTCLVLSAGLCGIIGSYFAFVARRIDARPEDREEADIAEGAGELGFFSPGSYWPLGLGLAATTTGLGIAFWQYWLIAAGAVSLLLAIGGLLFEYYAGQNEDHGHYVGSGH